MVRITNGGGNASECQWCWVTQLSDDGWGNAKHLVRDEGKAGRPSYCG
jgi:hypothetical protein